MDLPAGADHPLPTLVAPITLSSEQSLPEVTFALLLDNNSIPVVLAKKSTKAAKTDSKRFNFFTAFLLVSENDPEQANPCLPVPL